MTVPSGAARSSGVCVVPAKLGAADQRSLLRPALPSALTSARTRTLCAAPRYVCREDTLTQLFLSSVRKGKEAEACLAAKALGMHVVTLGASKASEHIFGEVRRAAALVWEHRKFMKTQQHFLAEILA